MRGDHVFVVFEVHYVWATVQKSKLLGKGAHILTRRPSVDQCRTSGVSEENAAWTDFREFENSKVRYA
jgi:hypothetical protein